MRILEIKTNKRLAWCLVEGPASTQGKQDKQTSGQTNIAKHIIDFIQHPKD